MSDITKKYVDYAGLTTFKSEVDNLIDDKISAIDDFTGATSSQDGVAGLVPAPEAGEQNEFLRGDGTWGKPSFVGTAEQWNQLSSAEKAKYEVVNLLNDNGSNNVSISTDTSITGVTCCKSGMIKQVTFSACEAAYLPDGFRPSTNKYLGFVFDDESKEPVMIFAETDGDITVQEMGTAQILATYSLYGNLMFMN